MTNRNQRDAIRAYMAAHGVNYTTAKRLLAEQRDQSGGEPPAWSWRRHAPSPTLHRWLVEGGDETRDYDTWVRSLQQHAGQALAAGHQRLVFGETHTARRFNDDDLADFPFLRDLHSHATRPAYDYVEYAPSNEVDAAGASATWGSGYRPTPADIIAAAVAADENTDETEATVEYLIRNPASLDAASTVGAARWVLHQHTLVEAHFVEAWLVFERALAVFDALTPAVAGPWFMDYQRFGNRAPLRCVHGAMLCRWYAEAYDEAEPIAEDLLRLVPGDRLGLRFDLPQIRARRPRQDDDF